VTAAVAACLAHPEAGDQTEPTSSE
jgi:hypothetical protein